MEMMKFRFCCWSRLQDKIDPEQFQVIQTGAWQDLWSQSKVKGPMKKRNVLVLLYIFKTLSSLTSFVVCHSVPTILDKNGTKQAKQVTVRSPFPSLHHHFPVQCCGSPECSKTPTLMKGACFVPNNCVEDCIKPVQKNRNFKIWFLMLKKEEVAVLYFK